MEDLASSPLISVQTSLYAMEEEIHDSITGVKGSYRKTKDSILQLHERNVPLQINCPIMKQNLTYYRDVLDFASSHNIESNSDYAIFGCYDGMCSNVSCRISLNDVQDILEKDIQDKRKQEEMLDSMATKRIQDDDAVCFVGKSSLCVSNIGDVYPCEGWQKKVLGNIMDRSLEDIWEHDSQTKYLRNLKFRDFKQCRDCGIRKYCTTCLVMNANENPENDYMKVNPYVCQLAEVRRAAIERIQL